MRKMQFAKEVRTFTCISCPCGCVLDVTMDDAGSVESIAGYTCNKGKVYGIQEATAPVRMVTAVVCVEGVLEPLSVKTAEAIPKECVGHTMAEIAALKLSAPISAGQVVCANVADTGIDVVATKSV